MEMGIEVTVNESKSLQASVLLPKELFQEWWLAEAHHGDVPREPLGFGLSLSTAVECLRIASGAAAADGRASTLELTFDAASLTLQMTLVDGIAVTECELRTLAEMDGPFEPASTGEQPTVRIVLKSEALREGLGELEWGGDAASQRDKSVTVKATPSPAQFSLTVSTLELGCEMLYPAEALISFYAREEVNFDYRFSQLHMAMRSVKESEEACLKIGNHGVLTLTLRLYSHKLFFGGGGGGASGPHVFLSGFCCPFGMSPVVITRECCSQFHRQVRKRTRRQGSLPRLFTLSALGRGGRRVTAGRSSQVSQRKSAR